VVEVSNSHFQKDVAMSTASKMMKSGAISEKEYGKLAKKKQGTKTSNAFAGKRPTVKDDDKAGGAVDEVSPSTSPKKVIKTAEKPDGLGTTPLSAKSKPGVDGGDSGSDTQAADNPSGKNRKRGSDTVTRGEPVDNDL
jgi:hypothetical protein